MVGQKFNVQDIVYRLQEEVQDVLRIAKEKGFKAYQNAYLISGGIVFAAFFIIYSPTLEKLEGAYRQVHDETVRADNAEKYESLKFRLTLYSSYTPKPEERDSWLLKQILDISNSMGISLDTIGAQTAEETPFYSIVRIPVSTRVRFEQLGKWLETFESHKPAIFVTSLNATRGRTDKGGDPGALEAELILNAVIPRPGKGP